MKTPRRAIVIGAGIAGPAVALSLKQAGIASTIYEAYPHSQNVGGGFQIAPNGMRALAALGVDHQIARSGVVMNELAFRNHHGRVVGRMRTDRAGLAVTLMRDSFMKVLTEELARQGIRVAYGKRIRDVTTEGEEVIAAFEDGTTERGDLLIASDGVRSHVRSLILPDHAAPRYTGMLGIGAFVPMGVAPPPDPEDAQRLTFMLGPKYQIGYATFGSEGPWSFWCHLPQEQELSREQIKGLAPEATKKRLLDAFAGWADPVDRFIHAAESFISTPIYDVPPLPSWHRGRVVLIGDAAHAMSPAGGQGASLALEDAVLLGRLLSVSGTHIEDALTRFENLRRPRAEPMVAEARQNDQRILKRLSPLGCWMRDRMFPLVAPLLQRSLVKRYLSAPGP